MKSLIVKSAVIACLALVSTVSSAETKPIVATVGFAPGGIFDALCRTYWGEYEKATSKSVVVKNITGAGSSLALKSFENNEADVGCIGTGAMIYSALDPKKEDPTTQVETIGQLVSLPSAILSSKHPAPKTIQEFKQLTLSQKTPMKVGSVAPTHELMVKYLAKQGFNVQAVQYQSAQQALPELISGDLDFWLDSGSLLQHAKPWNPEGKIHAYAWTGEAADHPQWNTKTWLNVNDHVPGMKDFPSWFGIGVNPNASPALKKEMREFYKKVASSKDFGRNLAEKFPNVIVVGKDFNNNDVIQSRKDLAKLFVQ